MYLVSVRVSVFNPIAVKPFAWDDSNSQKIV